ncbi:MAG TPA: four helix bundle protein [Cyclobacteriaceae bacterium]|jgi:four helix bundle protein|nr:four helix bundle protein [Cyclobacteriaceae bacterium]
MGKIDSYQDLDVWKQTKGLVRDIYELTKTFPKEEQFGLTNQLRRASISIPSNIAEGCGRNHFKDSIQFFFVSRGSLYEIETQVIIAFDLGYISNSDQNNIINKIKSCKRLLNGFINYFQNRSDQQLTTINEQLEQYGNSNTN